MKTKANGTAATKKPRAGTPRKATKAKPKITPLLPPQLDGACFPTLHSGMGKQSDGTVTVPGLSGPHAVTIESQHGNRVWTGVVTTKVSGDTWNATVFRVPGLIATAKKVTVGLDAISVTVTNILLLETSNEFDTTADVIP